MEVRQHKPRKVKKPQEKTKASETLSHIKEPDKSTTLQVLVCMQKT